MSCTGYCDDCCCCCCCCCNSLKGAAFFCTSVHIFLGLYLFVKWVVIILINEQHTPIFENSRLQIVYPLLVVYITLLVIIGCINFIAVEKESVKTLKWSTRFFLILQICEVLAHAILGFLLPDYEDGVPDHRLFHIKYMLGNFISTTIYFVIILLYTKQLLNGIYIIYEEENELKPTAPCLPPEQEERLALAHAQAIAGCSSSSNSSRHEDNLTLPKKN